LSETDKSIKAIDAETLEWRDDVPVAPEFGDVYYSVDGGLAETNYVFIGGIGAPEVWQSSNHYTVAETGFGTGLNFLATYKAWLESGQKGRLTFISVEQFPLSEAILAKAHSAFPEITAFAEKLRAAWPPPSPGFHHRFFEDGQIELILMFGEASACYQQLSAKIDAWYLDGFAPAKNPEMWTDALFEQIGRLSKPEARFATFTAAGFVKRGLAARGFNVCKTKGFGRKRERLVGTMDAAANIGTLTKVHNWADTPVHEYTDILVVGDGIAGRSLAAALRRRGSKVRIIGSETPRASDVPAAILAPAFPAGKQPAGDFFTSAFAHACWHPALSAAWQGERGVTITSSNPTERERLRRVQDLLGWPEDWLERHPSGLHFPRTGSVNTGRALNNALGNAIVIPSEVTGYKKAGKLWQVSTTDGELTAECLVLACGAATQFLFSSAKKLKMRSNLGQIAEIENRENLPAGSHSAGAYLTAAEGNRRTVGSSFRNVHGLHPRDAKVTSDDDASLKEKVKENLPFSLADDAYKKAWAGIRAMSHDYLPLIGPVPDWQATIEALAPLAKDKTLPLEKPVKYQEGLFLMTAFGSKGYQQAPYAAEILAAQITGDALPVSSNIMPYLLPVRFLVRDIIRKNSVSRL
jgi:tRNA 5-methylaminomethyl-2-thiouridine biosynthesis bifunctional protein